MGAFGSPLVLSKLSECRRGKAQVEESAIAVETKKVHSQWRLESQIVVASPSQALDCLPGASERARTCATLFATAVNMTERRVVRR